MVAPDCVRIGEALLLSCGFTEANTLSWSLAQVLDSLKCQVDTAVYNAFLYEGEGNSESKFKYI